MAITPYSGTFPNRLSAGDNEAYAEDVYNYLNYIDGTFVTTVNSTEVNINAKEASVVAKEAIVVANAATATTKAAEALASANIAAQSAIEAEAAVASLPDGTLNDALITLTNTYSAVKIESLLGGIDVSLITTPTITSPTTGAIDFIGTATKSAFATSSSYAGVLDYANWQLSYTSDFAIIQQESTVGNLTTWTPSVGLPLQLCYIRVKDGSDGHRSGWSPTVSFTTPNGYVKTPTLTVTGTPTDVPGTPTLTTSAFSVYNGTDTHASTDWEVRKASDNTLVWSSIGNASNKLSITVPSATLQVSTEYIFKARHNGTTYGSSAYVSVNGTTKSAPAPMQGQKGFGIEPCPAGTPYAALGLAEMTGTTTAGHDNYGNYIHTNGSIVCFYPRKFYRIGHASSPRYAVYGANAIDIEPASLFIDEAAANAAGYVLPRAFIDGGAMKTGFFRDKYVNSKKVGDTNVAVSVKNGNPIGLTTGTDYTPSSTMTGCTGILADAITLCRARGAGWNTQSIFISAWSMMISVAQGQAATNATDVAWYDATLTTNFPKGCNNGHRADVNDTSVAWSASPDSAAKGLTGSASNFAKSTDNGANNGCADVNGLMFQVALGMTNYGTSATDTTIRATNTVYVLKTSVALKDLTAGWDGANDAFGNTTHLAVLYDAVTSPVKLATVGAVYWGNGTNPVFDSAASGVGRDLCGFLPKNDTAVNATGINLLGNDCIYKYNRANMFPLLSGSWLYAAEAGVGFRYLSSCRAEGDAIASFRAVAYV